VPADILLPDFDRVDGEKWAVIACDQFTSRPEYWERAGELVGNSPSTLNLILPEYRLADAECVLPKIIACMEEYQGSILREYKDTMIYVERRLPTGGVRRGIVGAVDLECYDWRPGTMTHVRATEGTVPERIPPRVKIRNRAPLELPHIMLLADDPEKQIIEYFASRKEKLVPAYDFDLMLGGGHISAWFVDREGIDHVTREIARLADPGLAAQKYGVRQEVPLAIAVGDGNHSLATAKAVYEQVKAELGKAALGHPARYALAELVNIHDEALTFEPIFRVVFNTDPTELLGEFKEYCARLFGGAPGQEFRILAGGEEVIVKVEKPEHQLAVGTLQKFLDEYQKEHKEISVDYIHGEAEVLSLASRPRTVGFLYAGMAKDELFKTVICDGSLPRKAFSMGHAEEKRYYVEARKIR